MPLFLSVGVALGAVALGDLDAVAPALTMFFLTTNGMINLVAGIEKLTGDPSFRPTLRVPRWISLAGAVGCLWVMFLINPAALAVAIVVEVGVYLESVATSEMTMERNRLMLERVIRSARIEADIEVMRLPEGLAVSDVISRGSQDADVVPMGLRDVRPGDEADYADRLNELAAGLPSVLFVRSAGPFRGRLLDERGAEVSDRPGWARPVAVIRSRPASRSR